MIPEPYKNAFVGYNRLKTLCKCTQKTIDDGKHKALESNAVQLRDCNCLGHFQFS